MRHVICKRLRMVLIYTVGESVGESETKLQIGQVFTMSCLELEHVLMPPMCRIV